VVPLRTLQCPAPSAPVPPNELNYNLISQGIFIVVFVILMHLYCTRKDSCRGEKGTRYEGWEDERVSDFRREREREETRKSDLVFLHSPKCNFIDTIGPAWISQILASFLMQYGYTDINILLPVGKSFDRKNIL
jgi:hypothetical protein